MNKRQQFIILAAALTLVVTGCGKAATPGATTTTTPVASPTPNVTKVPAKEGAAAFIKTIDGLKGQLDQKKVNEPKKQSSTLEEEWASFEDEVKLKYPELYVKVEKFLTPLEAGLKQEKLDNELISQLNDGLKVAVTELSTSLNENKGAVNEAAISGSKELQEATKAYNLYVQEQGKQMVTLLEQLDAAVKSGDLKKAQEAYVQSRSPYERIEPIIERFKDLDGVMDARVDDFKDENDAEFTGYHRIEHLLFVKKTVKAAEPFSARLLEDGKKMQQSIAATSIEATDFVTGVGELMEEAQTKKITGEEERWSGASIPVIRANVEGAQKIYDLVKSELKKKDPALDEKISKSLTAVIDTMNTLSPVGTTWSDFSKMEQSKQVDLKNKLEALAEPLVKMPGTLGQ
ncbi:EfeM/EfeO family lipoprotein [Paenibacillus sp. SYP-B3998]|uniref:EfeM/EfeO family lipoprotein n=1 Tax=Paenibacillus sp. SYP-B3998 TaxID=2678564 RepID=A0A6G3ZWG5_9BACL|nr:EfeM/EfeO family lipoprotein [Paenibacillus sp. SYP-B3998]NEW06455.1 EfeM/EfeO family lipoprotein [Paenibacillus sp. SYP-B3998]